jgi:hypothetical protein
MLRFDSIVSGRLRKDRGKFLYFGINSDTSQYPYIKASKINSRYCYSCIIDTDKNLWILEDNKQKCSTEVFMATQNHRCLGWL